MSDSVTQQDGGHAVGASTGVEAPQRLLPSAPPSLVEHDPFRHGSASFQTCSTGCHEAGGSNAPDLGREGSASRPAPRLPRGLTYRWCLPCGRRGAAHINGVCTNEERHP